MAGVSSALQTLEKSVIRKLSKFYEDKISGVLQPIAVLRQAYDKQLKILIRKVVESAYKVGANVVADAAEQVDEDFELFISVTDIHNIAELTDRLSEQFWEAAARITAKEEHRKQEPVKTTVDVGAHLTALAVDVVYQAYNRTITSKMGQLAGSGIFSAGTRLLPALPSAPEPPLPPLLGPTGLPVAEPFLPIGFEIKRISPTGIGKVRFVTKQDAKVDPKICAPLDGMTWEIGDPNIVHPITDTHRYCRCRLEPFIETETGEIDIGFDTSTAETAANE